MDLVKTNHNTNNRANQFNTIINNEYLDNNLFYCNYNNEIYFTPDQIQVEYINSGRAEPYSGNIEIIKDYIKLTNRNNTYIDVGVNIATHSIVFSKLFNNIIAFEPDPINYKISKENIIINNRPNIKLYNKALGSKNKMVTTEKHSDHSRGCIITKDGGNIEAITLDSLNLKGIDYLKIDVEGHELDVLKGAIRTIKNNRPIIEFEYNHLAKKLFGVEYQDIDDFLSRLGYVLDKHFESNYYFIYNKY